MIKSKSPAKRKKEKQKIPQDSSQFPIVGIGASAGGLEAFADFLKAVPADSGMAYVLIQHLDPKHVSNLSHLLSRHTQLPIQEVTKETPIKANNVYIIPPQKNLSIRHRKLYLVPQIDHPGLTHNIDIFFRSLAEDLGERAIGIILSGTGSDGVVGAKAIKANMGLIMAQDPENAKFNGMPRAAITAGVTDFILPPEKMARQLIRYVEANYKVTRTPPTPTDVTPRNFEKILDLIRSRTKFNFFHYKFSTINRRIQRRMLIHQIESPDEYQKLLEQKPAELNELIRDFLINVTAFFRDKEAYAALEKRLPAFLNQKPERSMIRVWVPGCSSGEEAYSIAILLQEAVEKSKKRLRFQIFGTDMDSDAITVARRGVYPLVVAVDVGNKRLKKYFEKLNDGFYQIKRELREKLVFADQDFINDPPFSKIDIVSVRNLLIYFNADVQKKKIMPMLHYALNKGGLLFLGSAETVGELNDNFEVLDKKWKIFRNRERSAKSLPVNEPLSWHEPPILHPPKIPSLLRTAKNDNEHKMLTALPPSLLIDHGYNILYTHGDTVKYIRLPEGKPNMNILDMIRPELRTLMINAINEAFAQRRPIIRRSAHIKHNGDTKPTQITFKPIIDDDRNMMVITFEDINNAEPDKKYVAASTKDNRKIKDLESELKYSKENVRTMVEELETANEELRSANEEFQSTNEELQSTNEELETSREELQSVNEELITVNTEHQKKIEELLMSNDDMKNMLNCSGIATIFLDNHLNLLRFTPWARDYFNFIDSDIGRPLSHITSELKDVEIGRVVKDVLQNLTPVKREVHTKKGKLILMKIHPYRTTDNKIAGVVITLLDLNNSKLPPPDRKARP